MTQEDRTLIFALSLGKVPESEFLQRFPANPRLDAMYVPHLLEDAFSRKDGVDVECGMLLGFHFGFNPESLDVLCRIMREDWHKQHEDIASVMQQFKDPRCVETLYHAALAHFAYRDYDQFSTLAVKCLWALSAINTPESRAKLQLLKQSENQIISSKADELLRRSLSKHD